MADRLRPPRAPIVIKLARMVRLQVLPHDSLYGSMCLSPCGDYKFRSSRTAERTSWRGLSRAVRNLGRRASGFVRLLPTAHAIGHRKPQGRIGRIRTHTARGSFGQPVHKYGLFSHQAVYRIAPNGPPPSSARFPTISDNRRRCFRLDRETHGVGTLTGHCDTAILPTTGPCLNPWPEPPARPVRDGTTWSLAGRSWR
jgi:hypothetical protein